VKKVLTWILVLALLAGGIYVFRVYRQRQQAAALQNFKTVRAERGTLVSTIGATGTVRSNQSVVLTWQTSGTVATVNVQVGDLVEADEELAALAQTSLPQNIILAQADLANAQKALDDLLSPPTELELAQAQKAIADARKAVEDAQRRLDGLYVRATQSDIDAAKAQVVLAEDKLKKAQEDFDQVKHLPENDVLRATMQQRLANAQAAYDAAVRKLNWLQGDASELDIAQAEADLEVAKARLADAEENYQKLLDGPDPQDVAAAQARVAAAQAALDMAHITAPIAGTVTEVHVKPGDRVAPGQVAFRIDDLSHLLVDVDVSEVDINKVKIGQEVILLFDAVLDREYHGRVVEVARVGRVAQGVVSFTVTVELTDADEQVRPGMTAAVTIRVERLENVLLVPNRAVRIREGKRVVYVQRRPGTMPEPVVIQLGASSDQYSEVVGGDLKEGDPIVLNPPSENFLFGGPPGGRR